MKLFLKSIDNDKKEVVLFTKEVLSVMPFEDGNGYNYIYLDGTLGWCWDDEFNGCLRWWELEKL